MNENSKNYKKGIVYNKLVRDYIPEIIQEHGKSPNFENIQKADLKSALGSKILEEAHELFSAWQYNNPDDILKESADVLEVCLKVLQENGFQLKDLLEKQKQRRNQKGGFDYNIFLKGVDIEDEIEVQDSDPQLLFIPVHQNEIVSLIQSELKKSRRLSIASAFYTPGLANLLINDFLNFIEKGGDLRVLLSTMGNINRPEHLSHLPNNVQEARVRIYHPEDFPYESDPPNFHVKSYLFERDDGNGSLIIGSSNFTSSGFVSNIEWNYFSSSEINLPFHGDTPFQRAIDEFEKFWSYESVPLTEEFLKAYKSRFSTQEKKKISIEQVFDEHGDYKTEQNQERTKVKPNPVQVQALENLSDLRNQNVDKAAVVAATGVGKTHLAAFDFKQSNYKRVLYIAHRHNILHKAKSIFAQVLNNSSFGTVLGGGYYVDDLSDSVFAMIQTLSREEHLKQFSQDHFDYIVVDEFQHAEAKTYRQVIEYFKPKFFLGLTATPERMDGREVLSWCDYNIAYEVRLLEAVDRGWLTPFQYYAVYDPTDYEEITWKGNHYDEKELEEALKDDTRTDILAGNLKKYLPAFGKLKALAFCTNIGHAKYTARTLNRKHNIPAEVLVGEHDEVTRRDIINRLQDENDPLQIICCVDIFNEGVDIPNLTHICLLRPTQSFSLFLQQIGRGMRNVKEKDFLVIIDFVGNYKKVHVAPLALSGFTSLEDYYNKKIKSYDLKDLYKSIPNGCFVQADLEAQKIWQSEIQRIFGQVSRSERLKALYLELEEQLGHKSLQLMDILESSYDIDPKDFINHFQGWLRAKYECSDNFYKYEEDLLNTAGEKFLYHLESELNPRKSYKMSVLKVLLGFEGVEWKVSDIAQAFKDFYLNRPLLLQDFDLMANAEDPYNVSLNNVQTHIVRNPLFYLSNTDSDWFVLSQDKTYFSLVEEVQTYWNNSNFRDLVKDRVDFVLSRYVKRRGVKQNVNFEPSMLEWGFELDPFFVHRFLGDKKLQAGNKKKVTIEYQNIAYNALIGRDNKGTRYFLDYSDNTELINALRNKLEGYVKKGDKTLQLKQKSQNKITILDY